MQLGIFWGPHTGKCLMLPAKSGLHYFKYMSVKECKHIHLQ